MSLSIGKRDVYAIMKLLDPDYKTLTKESYDMLYEQAEKVLETAWERYESHAEWTVVGQLMRNKQGELVPQDPDTDKVALGNYQTETQATEAARSLVFNSATGETFRSWVLPVWHGTPAKWYSERKEEQEERARREAQPWLYPPEEGDDAA